MEVEASRVSATGASEDYGAPFSLGPRSRAEARGDLLFLYLPPADT